MRVDRLDISLDTEAEAIKKYLLQAGIKNFFLTPQYLKVIKQTYSYKVFYLVCSANTDLSGVASFYIKPGVLNKGSLVSVPGGFWSRDRVSEKRLINKLDEIAINYHLKGPLFKKLYEPLRTQHNPQITYRAVVNLPGNSEELSKSYSSNLRRKINKAKRSGLIVSEDRDLRVFYNVWSHNMRDLGTPAIPFSFFENMQKILEDSMQLLIVKKNNRCIGGAILLKYADIVFDPYISCLRSTFKYYPNNLLYHEMLTWAIRQKFSYFDLGHSQPDSGNREFKLQYGAELIPLYSHNYKDKRKPDDRLQSTIRNAAIKIWRRLPLSIANYLGPKIRRYIPFG